VTDDECSEVVSQKSDVLYMNDGLIGKKEENRHDKYDVDEMSTVMKMSLSTIDCTYTSGDES